MTAIEILDTRPDTCTHDFEDVVAHAFDDYTGLWHCLVCGVVWHRWPPGPRRQSVLRHIERGTW